MQEREQREPNQPRRAWPTWLPPVASLFIPGSGQYLLGQRSRGVAILATVISLAILVFWSGLVALLAPVLGVWLWNVWDAFRQQQDRESSLLLPVILGLLVVYGLGIDAVEVRPARLVTGLPSITPFVRSLFDPELFTYATEDEVGLAPIQVPCIETLPEPDRRPTESPVVTVSEPCAAVGDTIVIRGAEFFPNFTGELRWINPIGDVQRVIADGEPVTFVTDEEGRFEVSIQVPLAVPLTSRPGPGETQTHTIRAEQHRPYGPPQPTETLTLVLDKIGETIALAFMATVLGVIFAVPVSFLAARNLMAGNPVTMAIYNVVRTILNLVRSIETLIWAIIFAVWVGLGPFGGMLALWFHTVAALGKLYSEAIESIDPGPIEALRSTGARAPQVVVYAVIPQILPTFTSFTLYRWDINVRLSTVIGLISDAGLGFLIIQWIRLNRFSSMATALIAIVLVVATLDYFSSWLRQRIIMGTPAVAVGGNRRRTAIRGAVVAIFIAGFVWSWQVSEISFVELVRGAPDGLRLAGSFALPDLIDRPTQEHNVNIPLPVPCVGDERPSVVENGGRVILEPGCGPVGEPLTIIGRDLPPNTQVSVRWAFADGGYLRVRPNCCVTNADGEVIVETTIHPLMAPEEENPGELNQVNIVWTEVIGGPRPSAALLRVVDLALVTLLMALIATTLGSLLAIPLSFLAARNIMGDSALGRTVYNSFRSFFNIFRSIEPLILVLITAAWVGAGPFAGMLALTLNNIPNLGKLFSETIEEIDQGPVEALTSTGANRLQTLIFAIVPQLVPRFLAFIIYQWDINIRLSTVIGFVGGGGIGQQFRLWVGLNQYAAAGTATWAIVLMVWSMDYISARAREELV